MVFDDLPKFDFVDKKAKLLKDSTNDKKAIRWIDAAWLRDRFLNIIVHMDFNKYDLKDSISWHPKHDLKWQLGNSYDRLLSMNQDDSTYGICTSDPFDGLVDFVFNEVHTYGIPNEFRVHFPDNPIDIKSIQSFDRLNDEDLQKFIQLEQTLDGDFWVSGLLSCMLSGAEWTHNKYGTTQDSRDNAGFTCDWWEDYDETGQQMIMIGHNSMISSGAFHSYEFADVKDFISKGIDGGFSLYIPVQGQEVRKAKLPNGEWGDDKVKYGAVLKKLDVTWNNSTCRFECSFEKYRQMIFDAANDIGINLLTSLPGPSNEMVSQWIEPYYGLSTQGYLVTHLLSSNSSK